MGFLIHDNASGETVSIDTPEVDKIEAACSERAWNLTQIWNTHHHADHTGGNLDLKKKFGTKIYGPGIVKGRIPGLSHPLFGGRNFKTWYSCGACIIYAWSYCGPHHLLCTRC